MKKVIIIAMLLTVLSVCLLSTGVCFADETEKTSSLYYFEKTQATPQLALRAGADNDEKVLIYIPHSYAFEKLEEPTGSFVKVRYNSLEGYIQTNEFNSNCKQVNDKWGSNPYAYNLNFEIEAAEPILYNTTDLSPIEELRPKKSNIVCNNIYGFFTKNNEVYFLVNLTISVIPGVTLDSINYYIKLSDTSIASTFKVETIPVNNGYIAQTTPDKNPDDEINSGDNVPPVNDDTSPTRNPKNSLDRYIMIAVIAVLCVVIIVLIFIPNRKKS